MCNCPGKENPEICNICSDWEQNDCEKCKNYIKEEVNDGLE